MEPADGNEGNEGESKLYQELREGMVRRQLEARDITHPHVLQAMRKVPRHLFVGADQHGAAYGDGPLPIGEGQTISQPYIVALTLQLARAEPGKRALDIGTGSGYQAAVLAEIVDHVYTLEVHPGLARRAGERLRDLGYDNVTVRAGDGYAGWPAEAPFDLIVGAAAAPDVPQTLVDQLAPGARLVLPVGTDWQELVVVEKGRNGGIRRWSAGDVRFVPMVHGARDPDPPAKAPERDATRAPILLDERSRVHAPPEAVSAWHSRPGAVERLIPEWARVRPARPGVPLEPGRRIRLRSRFLRIEVECTSGTPGERLRIEQTRGPFEKLAIDREFRPGEGETCDIEDRITCVPRGPRLTWQVQVERLGRMLRAGHARVDRDLGRHGACGGNPARIVISGASGLIGSALVPFLTSGGHRVERLVRRPAPSGEDEIGWDPFAGSLDPKRLEGVDAVIHLAGENIAAGRWTPARREAIWSSRVAGTELLCGVLARLDRPPRVLLSASAIGLYGDRGAERLIEKSEAGTGFIPDLCRAWETATRPAEEAGIRVVHLRTGLVLTPRGGPLGALLPPARLGLCGPVGSGSQGMSWIAIDDLIGAIHHLLTDERLRGPVNLVGPHPVSQREFVRTLGRVLRRPAIAPLPARVVRTVFGEMGEKLLLEGAHVLPAKLQESGFEFDTPELEPALRLLLGRV
jgi:protein-L-isoaspartate(D-aspartate) O-methyltransferase